MTTFHVESSEAPFKKFASLRDEWALTNCYISPGMHGLFFHVLFLLSAPKKAMLLRLLDTSGSYYFVCSKICV
jgi:hypothetical protein